MSQLPKVEINDEKKKKRATQTKFDVKTNIPDVRMLQRNLLT